MKKTLTLGLIMVLILGLAGTAAAGNDKAKHVRAQVENELTVQSEATTRDLSQGAVLCELTIDYKTPGSGSGKMTLVAKRGSKVETFEASIPSGLTDDEALKYIMDTFAPMISETFGLEVHSFKVVAYSFDEETSVTTATFVAIHGKAPIRGLEKIAAKDEMKAMSTGL